MDIKATISQLTAERDKLDKAIQALQTLEDGSNAAPRATAPRTTRGRGTRRAASTNGSRANGARSNGARSNGARSNGARSNGAKALTPDNVVKLVTSDGVPASLIRQETGSSADAVLRVLKQLESDGTVKRSGTRRSTKWHLTAR